MASLRDQLAGMMVVADPPSRMRVINPFTRQPLRHAETNDEAWVDVLSDTSKQGRAYLRDQTDQTMLRRGRAMKSEDFEASMSEKAARLTVGWSLIGFEGQPLDIAFTPSNARDLYAMPEMAWLRDQVLEHCGDLGNWRRTSLTASSPTPNTTSDSTES